MTDLTHATVAAAVAAIEPAAIADARWFGAKGRQVTGLELEHAFVIDSSPPHVLAIVTVRLDDGVAERYSLALTGSPLRLAAAGEGAWRALAVLMHQGGITAALPRVPGETPAAALVTRPGPAMPAERPGSERDPGTDQSNTIVVLGDGPDAVLLKAYRRLQPGLNPDLEMTAFLTEVARFPAVPPLAGYAEVVDTHHGATTVAMAQAFIPDGADGFESLAEALVAWQLAPGQVSLELATEIAADMGVVTAGLHAAVANGHDVPDMAPRDASRTEVRGWARAARIRHERAVSVATGEARRLLRDLAPRIAEALSVLDAEPGVPEVIRAHGDLHVGQVLIAPDGFRIVDFEGEPTATIEERRAHRHPLRDVASMLRSFDHVARSAARRADERADDRHRGLDLDAWIDRARERYLAAYRESLLEHRVVPALDPDLLRAFEVDKELYEFAYAATYLPDWLYAPTAGMRALFDPRTPFEGRA